MIFLYVTESHVCPNGTNKCDSGHCYRADYRCDGDRDCDDATDERGCPTRYPGGRYCPTDEFECDNGVSTPLAHCLQGQHNYGLVCVALNCYWNFVVILSFLFRYAYRRHGSVMLTMIAVMGLTRLLISVSK